MNVSVLKKSGQSCFSLCDSMDHSPLGSSVHGILQARILEWISTPFSKRPSWPRGQNPHLLCEGGFFTPWAIREAHTYTYISLKLRCPKHTQDKVLKSYCMISLHLITVNEIVLSTTELPAQWIIAWSSLIAEKAMATHSSTLAWKIPWMEGPGGLQSMGLLRVGHDWVTSLSLFTFMLWRRKWQPTAVFLPGESQGWGSLVGCRLWGCADSDTTEVTQQQQQASLRICLPVLYHDSFYWSNI